jgi:tripartite-type tricarboxylate transporter receptor subunit TctC
MPYERAEGFCPIAMAVRAPLAIVVRIESPYKTLADL